jgi:hypothetical protein
MKIKRDILLNKLINAKKSQFDQNIGGNATLWKKFSPFQSL